MTTDRWRQGRRVGRTIYAQLGPEPADTDPIIGLMDTPELAAQAVNAHNAFAALSIDDLREAAYDVRWFAQQRGGDVESLELAARILAALEHLEPGEGR